jgi:hypothetical protein
LHEFISRFERHIGYGLDGRRIGVLFPVRAEIFLFTTREEHSLGTTQPFAHWIPWYLFGEADH